MDKEDVVYIYTYDGILLSREKMGTAETQLGAGAHKPETMGEKFASSPVTSSKTRPRPPAHVMTGYRHQDQE